MHHSKYFGQLYDAFMFFPEKILLNRKRKRLLSKLTGKVLEVGVGTGINLRFYGKDVKLTGIEPSPYMFERAMIRRNRLLNYTNITLHNIGCGDSETQMLFKPESLDAVVCTLVLCTIPDVELALGNFKKWLKPGGKLIVLEHILSHHPTEAKWQHRINPRWQRFADGCQLNRPTDKLIAEAGFTAVREKHFWMGFPFYEGIFMKEM